MIFWMVSRIVWVEVDSCVVVVVRCLFAAVAAGPLVRQQQAALQFDPCFGPSFLPILLVVIVRGV